MRFRLLFILLLSLGQAGAGGAGGPPIPPAVGETYDTSTLGTLYTGRIPAGVDFNVWFDPVGSAPARLVFNKTSLPATNLALGAAFGRNRTVYVLVQRALTFATSDQEVYAVDRVTGARQRVLRMSDLGLLLALGERFEYDAARDMLVFFAARTERAADGTVGQVGHTFEYGPVASDTPRLRQLD